MAPVTSAGSYDYQILSHSDRESPLSGSYTDTLSGDNFRPSEGSRAEPKAIPSASERSGRTLVLCFDGTGDQFDNDNSNVVEFFGMLKKDNPEEQLVYYQAGIGTYTSPMIATPLVAKISKSVDTAIAWNLGSHITDGYEFLMQNYRAGDKICIFGFSRGAYTARCLIGMIFKVGLLPMCNHQQVPFAYHMYTLADKQGWEMSNAFRRTFSIEVDIEFVGLWDSVDSVGLVPRRLPFATSKTVIRTFRHALALDEHRAKFKANTWNRPSDEDLDMAATGLNPKDSIDQKSLERIYGGPHQETTNIKEVWFAGCHCDVGGGSVSNGTTPNLARIPLRWMIRECFRRSSGIIFIEEKVKSTGIDLSTLVPEIDESIDKYRPNAWSGNAATFWRKAGEVPENLPIPKTEEEAEFYDALSPIYDQLAISKWWWILEYIPFTRRVEKGSKDVYERKCNRYGGRHIQRAVRDGVKYEVMVHRSVQIRRAAHDLNGYSYQWKADLQKKIDADHVIWVD